MTIPDDFGKIKTKLLKNAHFYSSNNITPAYIEIIMVEIEKIMPVTMRRYFFLIFFVLIPLVANAVDYDGDFYTEVFYLRDRGNGSAPETVAGAWSLSDVKTQ